MKLQSGQVAREMWQVHFNERRPFVREFIELVRTVTGKLYSPEIYRRLLDAYAPGRRPSMGTLASERERAGRLPSVAMSAAAASDAAPGGVPAGLDELRNVVGDVVEAKLGRIMATVEQVQNAQVEFYQYQLQEAEAELKALRARVTDLGAELAAVRQSAEQYRAEVDANRALIERNTQTIEALSRNAEDMRKFALMSIEDARAETRSWKDRCIEAELQRERDAQALDTLRRAGYQSTAAAVKDPFK